MPQLEAEIEILPPPLYCTEFCSDCLRLRHLKHKCCSDKTRNLGTFWKGNSERKTVFDGPKCGVNETQIIEL